MICDHEWTRIEVVERAEIDERDPVAHTAFVVLGCVRCRTVDAFPASNAARATPRFIEALRRDLAARGWTLPPTIVWGPKPPGF